MTNILKDRSTKDILKNDGIFNAIFKKHPSWAMAIWEQPCFVMPSQVGEGTTYDRSLGDYIPSASESGAQRLFAPRKEEDFLNGLIAEKKNGESRGPAVLLARGFMREILGVIIHNPWLYWKQTYSLNYNEKWRGTYRNPEDGTYSGMSVALNPVTKLIFCIFKVFGSPLILVYFAAKFFYVFMIALNIPQFGKALAQSLLAIFAIGPVFFQEPVKKYLGTHQYFTEKEDGSFDVETVDSVPFVTAIRYYIGMVIPYQIFGEKGLGETYGNGGLSLLIILFMVISAFIIIISGLNIAVICIVFFIYMFKTIDALKTSAMGDGSGGR